MREKVDVNSKEKGQHYLKIPSELLKDSDSLEVELEMDSNEKEIILDRTARCVSVATFSFAPEGRKEKKGVFKGKSDLVKFRCSIYEKKLLNIKATRSGMTLSEYIRRTVFEKEITERFTEEHIQLYKMLIKYHNNFKAIGNMYRKRDPKLMETVYDLANEIKLHLKKFQQ
ncbi:mobilization protein MbpA [Gelidibacter salicanalis]|uniref:mobilization protein MbpA n=1 Tax=Gelidibacter salicanalis TaxID=291193 RepID=UPI001F393E37|nr:mobilization protein MbpA [Gelidibacter salicanalis]